HDRAGDDGLPRRRGRRVPRRHVPPDLLHRRFDQVVAMGSAKAAPAQRFALGADLYGKLVLLTGVRLLVGTALLVATAILLGSDRRSHWRVDAVLRSDVRYGVRPRHAGGRVPAARAAANGAPASQHRPQPLRVPSLRRTGCLPRGAASWGADRAPGTREAPFRA